MANTLKLSPKFQISIPKEIRARLSWKAGQRLSIVQQDDGVFVVPEPDIEELRGLMKGADPTGYRDRDDRH